MTSALDLLMDSDSTAETTTLLESNGICTIDSRTRTIFVPPEIVVGAVQSDKNAERIKFSCPKIVGDNLDLSKFSIRINFENVSSVDPDISIKDQYICEDASINEANITFSWVIGKNAARYMGTIRFIVCAVKTDSDSNISIEWNTTVAQIPVLEGIEVDQPSLDENNKDIINQLLAITKTASDEAVKNVNSAKEQAITDIQNVLQPDKTLTVEGGIADAKATGNAISSLREDIGSIAVIGFQYLNPSDAEQRKFYSGYGNISETSDGNYFLYPIFSLPKGKYYLTNVSEAFTYFEDGTQLAGYYGYDKKTSTLELSETTKIAITGYKPASESYIALSNVEVSSDVYGVISIVIIGDDISKRTSTLENKTSDLENRHIVTVGNGKDFQTIKSAVESITDSSKQNVYDIYIDDGIYEEYAITLPDYVNLIGASGNREKCVIKGELPDSASETEITTNNTINLMDSNVLENLTITAKNLRYPIHSESGGTHTNWVQILNNCHVEHFGNTSPNNKWTSYHAWGEGASSGAYAEFNNCTFKSLAEPWYVHDFAYLPDIPRPYHHILNNCQIINTTVSNIASWLSTVKIDNTKNSDIINAVDFNNCNFYNGEIAINDVCTINVSIHGGNNAAIRFENDCPDTDYTHIKTYVGEVGITRNTVLKYADGINLVKKATASTPTEMIAGIAMQDCELNSLVKIIKGTYVNKTGNVGTKVYCDDNGQLTDTGTNVIGICYGEFSLIN